MSVSVRTSPSDPEVEPEPVFLQEGKLAKLFPADDGAVKALHRRVAAAVVIEEKPRTVADELVLYQLIHVVHGPFAVMRAEEELFKEYPQLVVRPEGTVWTDRLGSPVGGDGADGD